MTIPNWFNQGGPVMWPLLAFSFLVVTISAERCWFWIRLYWQRTPKDIELCLNQVKLKQLDNTLEKVRHPQDPALVMLAVGLAELPHDSSGPMETAAKSQLDRMASGQTLLDTIITLAPMLGILGTVLGIIDSFNILTRAGVENPTAVVGGIAQALTTTAAGLCIAVAALLPYNLFRRLQHKEALRLEAIGSRFEAAIGRLKAPLSAPANDDLYPAESITGPS